MLMQDLIPGADWNVTLLGVDLNPQVLEKARAARYSSWSLRETPPEARRRWFRPERSEFVLHPDLRAAVRFEELNLSTGSPDFWRPAAFDLIFARNVLMYFSRPAQQAAAARMIAALAPDGYFFLGHSESLRELTHGLRLCHTHETFYYQKESDTLPRAEAEFEGGHWFENIGRAAERVRGLTTRARTRTESRNAVGRSAPRGADLVRPGALRCGCTGSRCARRQGCPGQRPPAAARSAATARRAVATGRGDGAHLADAGRAAARRRTTSSRCAAKARATCPRRRAAMRWRRRSIRPSPCRICNSADWRGGAGITRRTGTSSRVRSPCSGTRARSAC